MMTNVVGLPARRRPQRHGGDRHLGAAERRAAAGALPAAGDGGGVSVPEDERAAAAQGMLHAWWAASGSPTGWR